jgi:acetate kinase
MEMECLVVNIGSSSKKYALYRGQVQVFSCHFEHEDGMIGVTTVQGDTHTHEKKEVAVFDAAAQYFLDAYHHAFGDVTITTISVRVVAPGSYFQEHRIIDETYIAKLTEASSIAPLHIKATLDELHRLRQVFPGARCIAASDSAFHSTMPRVAQLYGLPRLVSNEYDIKRFGYHGLSVSSVVESLRHHTGDVLPERIIVLHLGSGCSATALRKGQTIDTSMGFTPLEGLLMSTRSGSFDPTIIFSLLERGLTREEIEMMLNTASGLRGVSDTTSDMREIIERSNSGDRNAGEALELFVYTIAKIVGAYTAALGGLDALVFTGTIGERSFIVRGKILDSLTFLIPSFNRDVNNQEDGSVDRIAEVTSAQTGTRVYVVPTNESLSIIQAVKTFE